MACRAAGSITGVQISETPIKIVAAARSQTENLEGAGQ